MIRHKFLAKRYRETQYRSITPFGKAEEANSRVRILDVIRAWITSGGGRQDILDDPTLFTTCSNFFDKCASSVVKDTPAGDIVLGAVAELQKLFNVYAGTPSCTNMDVSESKEGLTPPRMYGLTPPDIDSVTPEEFLENLDAIASAVTSMVTVSDLLATSDLLEVQLLERSLCLSKDPNLPTDEVVPETIHILFHKIEPSPSLSNASGKEHLVKMFPPSVRNVLRVHAAIRAWVVTKLSAIGLGSRTREERIELVLRTVELCRSRAPTVGFARSEGGLSTLPAAPSLVEAACLAALWSPESRIYARAWANVAAKRNKSHESFEALLAYDTSPSDYGEQFIVDGGWVFEQMLRVMSLPDTVVNKSELALMNYDKRRYVCRSRTVVQRS